MIIIQVGDADVASSNLAGVIYFFGPLVRRYVFLAMGLW